MPDYLTPGEAIEQVPSALEQLFRRIPGMRNARLWPQIPRSPESIAAQRSATQEPGLTAAVPPPGAAPVLPGPMAGPSPYSQEGITSMLDMRRLVKDFDAVKTDPEARARIQALGPALVGEDKPKPAGTTPISLPGARGVEGMIPSSLPSARKIEGMVDHHDPARPGGGGVEVKSPEEAEGNKAGGRDWASTIAGVGVGLSDIFNTFGNQRNRVEGGGYELMKQHLRDRQMETLQRRHQMFDDAYTEAKSLPPEVYADPEKYGSLIQAAQNLRQAGEQGKIDDEKAISAFLTEKARFGGDIKDLVAQSQLQQKIAEQAALKDAEYAQMSRLAAAYPELVVTPRQEFTQKGDIAAATNERYRDVAEENRAARLEAARLQAQARGDTQQAGRNQRAAAGLNSVLSQTLRNYEQRDEDGNILNPEEAQKLTLRTHADDIIFAGQQTGLRIQKAGTPDQPLLVINGRPMDAATGLQYIRSVVMFGGLGE